MSNGVRANFEHQGHYAGPVSRLLAYGVDLFVVTTTYGAGLALLQFAINTATPWEIDLKNGYVWVIVGQVVWFAIYLGGSWAIFARTPGMSLLGLRIVRSDGAALERRRAMVRLVAFPLGFLTLGIGFLGIIFKRTHQAIYDRIARTAVIYDWDAEAARLRNLAARGARRREVLQQGEVLRQAEPKRATPGADGAKPLGADDARPGADGDRPPGADDRPRATTNS